MIKYMSGNVLNAKEDIIVHQVNCRGVMGGGVALQIRNKYPEVYRSYKELCNSTSTPLGECQIIKLKDKIFANLFGQDGYSRKSRQTNYEALYTSLSKLNEYCRINKLSIAIPYMIGCGLGGGKWNIVRTIIEETLKDCNVVVYKYIG